MILNNLIYSFSGFIATDFSSYYIDFYNTYPNSLIPTTGNISIYEGIYKQIIPYIYNGIYVTTNNSGTLVVPYIELSIENTSNYINKNGIIKYINTQIWLFTDFSITIDNNTINFEDIYFYPKVISDNKSEYNLINEFKGITFPKSIFSWYSTQISNNILYSFQMIWGQGDIPLELYSICGFSGSSNIQSQNPFTNSNGPYYSTYITPNNNYANNSGWIIILAGPFDSTLTNPSYLEDV